MYMHVWIKMYTYNVIRVYMTICTQWRVHSDVVERIDKTKSRNVTTH